MRDLKPDPMHEPMDIVTRLSQRVAESHPTEQKIAQTVLGDIAKVAAGSIQTLIECAGVSEANVTRFTKAMDYRDVRELKLKLAQAAAAGQHFLDGGADRLPSSADDILADISSALEANRALVRPEALRAATVVLVMARMIAVSGMGSGSTIMTDETYYRFARLGRPVITCHDSMLQWMVAAMLSPDDMAVMFSVTGHVPEAIDSMAITRRYGTRIVAIMTIGSPLAVLADALLPIQAMETDFIFKPSSSRYTMMMMIDLLAIEVALQQADRDKELLWHTKYMPGAYRSGGNRQPLGD